MPVATSLWLRENQVVAVAGKAQPAYSSGETVINRIPGGNWFTNWVTNRRAPPARPTRRRLLFVG